MIKQFIKERKNQKELLRFLIVGLICTAVDFIVSALIQYVIYPIGQERQFLGFTFTSNIFVAALAGFIFGVITNYILSIIVVFKDVENTKTSQSFKGFVIFVVLSAIGFLINYLIKELGNRIIAMDEHFLWFVFVFGVATLVVLIYNYITRKIFLFKPKKILEDTTHEENSN